MAKLIPTEIDEAITLWEWAQYHPIARNYLLHIPNERKTSYANGRKLKAQGVRKGVSDYFLAYPAHGEHGLWIELKRIDMRISKLTLEQTKWLRRMEHIGFRVCVAYGAQKAIEAIDNYLVDVLAQQTTA